MGGFAECQGPIADTLWLTCGFFAIWQAMNNGNERWVERLVSWAEIVVPVLTGCMGLGALLLWVSIVPVEDVVARVPGLDRRPAQLNTGSGLSVVPQEPVVGTGTPADIEGEWPGFRGPRRDGVGTCSVPLARKWLPTGPPILWQVTLGPGHAGPAVARGRVLILDYDVQARADTLRCLSLADGQEIWRNSYPADVPENHGSSRTVPAIAGNYVVTIGPKCHLACWELETGRCLWFVDLVGRYGSQVPPWYTGQCPLVDGDLVIVAPGGETLMVAFDLATGSERWRTPGIPEWQMSHASVVPVEIGERKMYIYPTTAGIVGVDAATGTLLWSSTDFVGKMATCPSPVVLPDGMLFFTGGYGAGSLLARLVADGQKVHLEALRRISAREYGSEHQTPIFYEGFLFGSRCPPGAQQFLCMTPEGKVVWTSGADRFVRGAYLIADGLLYAIDESGTLFLIEATPEAYRVLDRFKIWPDTHDAWGPMALVAGRLLVRDLTRLVCLDVSAAGNGG
jgi:outer membrane protein assembly factor BamB